jgi:hypothetical protein
MTLSRFSEEQLREMFNNSCEPTDPRTGLTKAEILNRTRENRKIYFIIDDGLVKVGYSEYPHARLDQIKTSRPKARILNTIRWKTGLERKIHKAMSKWHYGGEWFYYNLQTQKIIEEYINAN